MGSINVTSPGLFKGSSCKWQCHLITFSNRWLYIYIYVLFYQNLVVKTYVVYEKFERPHDIEERAVAVIAFSL